ncbi:MAG: hypothetical protein JSV63_00400 [Candidatus Aenigmatarchaeota archaeon]|nr:MAG: hypothetical protein JSV63_00400 [Candidatus Aenigmarchaeota archaeon]
MKFAIFSLITALVGLSFLVPGVQITGAYYAEPSGYGFYHIWFGNLYLSVSMTLFGIIALIFVTRRASRMLF